MDKIRGYYNRFKIMNPKNTELKLGIIIFFIFIAILKGIRNIQFSWELLISLGVFIVSMTFHEVAHGYTAYIFGDDTAKRAGRITLNPLKHLDIAGLILPLLILLSGSKFLIGWAKPVPVNFYRLKPERLGSFFVAIAGIVVNMLIAFIALVFIRLLGNRLDISGLPMTILIYLYLINLLLAFFNLIPITPLDGGRIVYSVSGKKVRDFYDRLEKYGILIVFLIVYTGIFSNVFGYIFNFFIDLTGLHMGVVLK